MKLTKSKLLQIIREETQTLIERTKRKELAIPESDKKAVLKILKKLDYRDGIEYDLGAGRGATFILDMNIRGDIKKVLKLFKKYRVRFKELR